MKINIKATGIELTEPIRAYITSKLGHLTKHLKEEAGEAIVQVEVGKTTHHHRQGEVFKAEINLDWQGQYFRSVAIEEDLYAAIDLAKDEMVSEVTRKLKRRVGLIRRGARAFKRLFSRGNGGYEQ